MLIALGSPLWLSLGIAVAAMVFALYVSLWTIMMLLWAVFGSPVVCAVASVPVCVAFAVGGCGAPGLALLSAEIVCAGLSSFLFYGCKEATKGILALTKNTTL